MITRAELRVCPPAIVRAQILEKERIVEVADVERVAREAWYFAWLQ